MAVAAGQIITAADLTWGTAATTLTDDSAAAVSTWEQWGTETIQFDDPGVPVMVRGWVSGRLRNFTDATSSGSARVSISIDGGVTYTAGAAYSVEVGTGACDRTGYASTGFVSGTPTGDIIVKADLFVSDTSIVHEAGNIMADIFPL